MPVAISSTTVSCSALRGWRHRTKLRSVRHEPMALCVSHPLMLRGTCVPQYHFTACHRYAQAMMLRRQDGSAPKT